YDNLPLTVSRFVAAEEGVRAELNSWAAWIEQQENNPHRDRLMRQFIAVRQVFTAEVPGDGPDAAALGKLALEVCRHVAAQTGGYYQVDDQGLFAPDGTLLVAETSSG